MSVSPMEEKDGPMSLLRTREGKGVGPITWISCTTSPDGNHLIKQLRFLQALFTNPGGYKFSLLWPRPRELITLNL